MEDELTPRAAPLRPAPPQSVPKPVVPEVSLMFSSDDSLILQPTQFIRKQTVIPSSALERETVIPSSALKKSTVSPNSFVRKECVIPSSSLRKDVVTPTSSVRQETVNPSSSRKETMIPISLSSEIPHSKPVSIVNGFGASRGTPPRVPVSNTCEVKPPQHSPLARYSSNGIEQTKLNVEPVRTDVYTNDSGRLNSRDHILADNRHVTFSEDTVNYHCKDIYSRTSSGRYNDIEIVDCIDHNRPTLFSAKPSTLLNAPLRNEEKSWEDQSTTVRNKFSSENWAKMGLSYQSPNNRVHRTIENGPVPRAKTWLAINAETEQLRNVETERSRNVETERLRNTETEWLRNADSEQLRTIENERLRNVETEQMRNSPTSYRKLSEGIPKSTFDPYVYQLIEDQNQQIGRLKSAIEILLSKHNDKEKETLPSSVPNSVEKCSKSTQTEEAEMLKTKVCSVGVNTSVIWLDHPKPIENQKSIKFSNVEKDDEIYWQFGRSHEASPVLNASPVLHTNQCSSPSVRPKFPDGFYERMPKKSNKSNLVPESERGEVSLTLGDVVVQTIHDDPPSPDPSIHVYMQEYLEDPPQSGQNRGASGERYDSSNASPMLGESASTYECKMQSNHRGVTFYKNVLTNVQNILQNTPNLSEEDEEEEVYNRPQYVAAPDLQLQAIEKQLKHFGISFIKPKGGKEKLPAVDSVYFNGMPNILSIYNVNTSENSPLTCISQIGATTAKYLKESQLAAITAFTPEYQHMNTRDHMKNKNTDLVIQGTYNPSNFSLASKKFLGKYGLNLD